jgi:hypothetical protein
MSGDPQKGNFHLRLGFREKYFVDSNADLYNHPNIGGDATGTYNQYADYLKYSCTVTNIIKCDETPPAGA